MAKQAARSWLAAVLQLRCPRCRRGDLFPTGTLSFSKPFDMHKQCPVCKLNYWPEPGFYYGAMFLSYIMYSFPILGLALLLTLVFGFSLNEAMLVVILVSALIFVYLFRVARSLWLAMNVKYNQRDAEDFSIED